MKKIIYTFIFLMTGLSIYAQQDAEYSMYFFNGLYLNPAYAGSKDALSVSGLYRHQWVNIEGAPRSASISLHSPFKKSQYALGVTYSYDQLGLTQTNNLYGSFAYRIKTQGTTKVSLGLQAGFSNYQMNDGDAVYANPGVSGDGVFTGRPNLLIPNFGAGVYAYNEKYYVGFSVPHILNNSLSSKLELRVGEKEAKSYTHFLATMGYVIGKESSKVKFLPSILGKFAVNSPVDLDFTANFIFLDRLMLGASYRLGGNRSEGQVGSGESIIGIAKFAVTKQLELGYAYDYTLSDLGAFNSGTHEIYLGYNLDFNKKRFATPRFITYF